MCPTNWVSVFFFAKMTELKVVDLVCLASHRIFDTLNYGKSMFETKEIDFDATTVKASKGLAKAEATRHSFEKRNYPSGGRSLVEFLKDQC